MIRVIGWDIGGANVKAARLLFTDGRAESGRTVRRYFELWNKREGLHPLLQEIHSDLGSADAMVLTMTGELCDAFHDRAEGVAYIIDAVREAIPGIPLYAIDLEGRIVRLDGGEADLLTLAATNWIAEARVLASRQPNCLMMDIGSTTTDLIPILDGKLAAQGKRDIERLAHGELIYTGALRTPVAAIVSQIPMRGVICRIAAEYFAISADVYLALGRLTPEDYTCATPDGREKTKEGALERLARVACEDSKHLTAGELHALAAYIAEKQLQQITEGMLHVLSRIENGLRLPVVSVGIGAFLGEACTRRMYLTTCDPPVLTDSGSVTLSPCAAAAYLLGQALSHG
ncbi:H4MPT-linked C1 transfer pathway protein [Candidatus Methylomirabilis limnetica]|uniref:H4MPT-linked C1 transfer pathway protein n=1 Tax=Candidatus Methylomirabilis limnetica TaxID=2033718 RepID=A0A2T4U0X5_9BACT|nr:hydantoinase/oxoprolinase family protein [Candidatus Methylomirabilis limnetica]PTL37024.1 H4MPT-linked C1 transfer pathway protein [Candidatus Methylomirabilis limnetica]